MNSGMPYKRLGCETSLTVGLPPTPNNPSASCSTALTSAHISSGARSGYDFRTEEGYGAMMAELKETVGIESTG